MAIYKLKEKKNGLQKYRVRINFTDSNGSHKQVERTAWGKDEAKEIERQLENEIKSPVSSKMTDKNLFDEYIER